MVCFSAEASKRPYFSLFYGDPTDANLLEKMYITNELRQAKQTSQKSRTWHSLSVRALSFVQA